MLLSLMRHQMFRDGVLSTFWLHLWKKTIQEEFLPADTIFLVECNHSRVHVSGQNTPRVRHLQWKCNCLWFRQHCLDTYLEAYKVFVSTINSYMLWIDCIFANLSLNSMHWWRTLVRCSSWQSGENEVTCLTWQPIWLKDYKLAFIHLWHKVSIVHVIKY